MGTALSPKPPNVVVNPDLHQRQCLWILPRGPTPPKVLALSLPPRTALNLQSAQGPASQACVWTRSGRDFKSGAEKGTQCTDFQPSAGASQSISILSTVIRAYLRSEEARRPQEPRPQHPASERLGGPRSSMNWLQHCSGAPELDQPRRSQPSMPSRSKMTFRRSSTEGLKSSAGILGSEPQCNGLSPAVLIIPGSSCETCWSCSASA